ncbi:MAG: hypothetical protein K8S23_01990 [Candidatus Cloacimonetes bacterium]|nr:hypothetical protein [Candidatus Cloacimonadota bacterium]
MKKIIIILSFLLLFSLLTAEAKQARTENYVSLSIGTSIPDAFRAIEILSQKETGKKIINLSIINTKIEFPINQMYWKDALFLIIKLNDLVLEELPGAFKVKDPEKEEKKKSKLDDNIEVETQQVKISATFFQTSKDMSKGIGIDWSTVFNGDVNARVDFKGGSGVANDIISASGSTTIDNGNVTIDINTLLKILEAREIGNIIARPVITVLSEKSGEIQVGSSFSIKTLDIAGNVADEFYDTGLILSVSPTIIEKDGIEAIHLETRVENSAVVPGQERTTIGKSQSATDVLLYDGETTVMAGLFSKDVTTIRNGVPFLKDLPWWIFGIRYLTGVNKEVQSEKEMVVILKAEIVDTIKERMENIIPITEQFEKDKKQRDKTINMFEKMSFGN